MKPRYFRDGFAYFQLGRPYAMHSAEFGELLLSHGIDCRDGDMGDEVMQWHFVQLVPPDLLRIPNHLVGDRLELIARLAFEFRPQSVPLMTDEEIEHILTEEPLPPEPMRWDWQSENNPDPKAERWALLRREGEIRQLEEQVARLTSQLGVSDAAAAIERITGKAQGKGPSFPS